MYASVSPAIFTGSSTKNQAPRGGQFVAAFEDEGRLVGAFCVNSPGKMPRLKRMIAAHSLVGALDGGLS